MHRSGGALHLIAALFPFSVKIADPALHGFQPLSFRILIAKHWAIRGRKPFPIRISIISCVANSFDDKGHEGDNEKDAEGYRNDRLNGVRTITSAF